MSKERGSYQDPEWAAFARDLEHGRERAALVEDLAARLGDVLAANADRVDELLPGQIVHNVCLTLEEEGWEHRKFYAPVPHELIDRIPELVAEFDEIRKRSRKRSMDPIDDFLVDVWANDPLTGLSALVQVGFAYPTRPRALAVRYHHPRPDLVVYALTELPRMGAGKRASKETYEENVAWALRDVELPLRVHHLLEPFGEAAFMDDALRDKALLRRERKRRGRQAEKKPKRDA